MNKERILIVEDERIISLDLQRRLEKFGYNVLDLCTTGAEALEKTEKLLPDIILMDIMLAGDIDGVSAAYTIKENFQIPVIFLTAYADSKTLERAKEAEPFGYILKPFKEKELYTTIDIALYKHKIDKSLKKQERFFFAILHSVADGLIAMDNERRIQFMNPIAEKITGWEEKDAVSLPCDQIISIFNEEGQTLLRFSDIDTAKESTPIYFKNATIRNRHNNILPVEGAVALIRDKDGTIEGQVIAIRDVSELRKMSSTISYQASHDALTGLLNREAFSARLETLLNTAKTDFIEHALIYLDLDQFKLINDTIGQAAGDTLLRETTAIMKNVFRSGDTCARLGGDEFGVLLENTDLDTAQKIASRLQSRLADKRLDWSGNTFNIHTSVGLVIIDSESEDLHSVLAAADDACYIAKDEGGKRIRVYKPSDHQIKKRRGEMQWVTRLVRALEEERFVLYFQPIHPLSESAKDSKTRKVELLIRMIDEDDNIIPPASFIPAAETYNLMPSLDRWVVKNAMEIYARNSLHSNGRPYMFTINLSADSIADEKFLYFIQDQIRANGVAPEHFCFEITETVTISNMSSAGQFIEELKSMGCTFALDDFGSGFSSFNYLKNMPIDYLKIDGSFVKDMHENSVNSAMVEAMNNLGHVMGIRTIAEFAANSAILEKLGSLGVDYAQGYEIARPEPITTLLKG